MELSWFISRMKANAESMFFLLQDLDEEQAHRRADLDAWSIVEIVNHLADEEREDFRTRLELTLADSAAPWPGIDPPAWVRDRKYQELDLRTSLQRFLAERKVSLAWLESLDHPDWDQSYSHPSLGSIRASDLLVSWHAHDLLHIRQIARRLFDTGLEQGSPGKSDYAGSW